MFNYPIEGRTKEQEPLSRGRLPFEQMNMIALHFATHKMSMYKMVAKVSPMFSTLIFA